MYQVSFFRRKKKVHPYNSHSNNEESRDVGLCITSNDNDSDPNVNAIGSPTSDGSQSGIIHNKEKLQ